jgi:hypothetical protein
VSVLASRLTARRDAALEAALRAVPARVAASAPLLSGLVWSVRRVMATNLLAATTTMTSTGAGGGSGAPRGDDGAPRAGKHTASGGGGASGGAQADAASSERESAQAALLVQAGDSREGSGAAGVSAGPSLGQASLVRLELRRKWAVGETEMVSDAAVAPSTAVPVAVSADRGAATRGRGDGHTGSGSHGSQVRGVSAHTGGASPLRVELSGRELDALIGALEAALAVGAAAIAAAPPAPGRQVA